MQVRVYSSPGAAARAVARLVADTLQSCPRPVLALPTGQTAVPFYAALVDLHRAGHADFHRTTTFNLDEFVGLARRDPRSYRDFMTRHLFAHVNLPPMRGHLFNGLAVDLAREARRFEQRIALAGGLDLAVLGLGGNGHLALNEPAHVLQAGSHVARLRLDTRRANAREFGGRWQHVPTHALTMGMATMLNARAVVLLALGAHKASVLARALTGPITTRCPASLLQLHPDVSVVCDRAAAGKLPASFTRPRRAPSAS